MDICQPTPRGFLTDFCQALTVGLLDGVGLRAACVPDVWSYLVELQELAQFRCDCLWFRPCQEVSRSPAPFIESVASVSAMGERTYLGRRPPSARFERRQNSAAQTAATTGPRP